MCCLDHGPATQTHGTWVKPCYKAPYAYPPSYTHLGPVGASRGPQATSSHPCEAAIMCITLLWTCVMHVRPLRPMAQGVDLGELPSTPSTAVPLLGLLGGPTGPKRPPNTHERLPTPHMHLYVLFGPRTGHSNPWYMGGSMLERPTCIPS
jgi:hypothetical protein